MLGLESRALSVADTTPQTPAARKVNVPPYVMYCLTLIVVTIIAAFVVLSATGADTTELRAWLNTLFNSAGLLVGAGGLTFAASADRKAGRAVEQTNGGLVEAVRAVMEAENRKQSTRDSGGSDGGGSPVRSA